MSNSYSISTWNRTPFKNFKRWWRVSVWDMEGIFFLLYGIMLWKKGIKLWTTFIKDKMDFYVLHWKKKIWLDFEMVGDVLLGWKHDMEKWRKITDNYLKKNQIDQTLWFYKWGWSRVITRKFVSKENHNNLLSLLNKWYQSNEVKKHIFNYDLDLFNPLYQQVYINSNDNPADRKQSHMNSWNTHVNCSQYVRYLWKENYIQYDQHLKNNIVEYYNTKKNNEWFSWFYLIQSIINWKVSIYLIDEFIKNGLIDILDDYCSFYEYARSNIQKDEIVPFAEFINYYDNKEILFKVIPTIKSIFWKVDYMITNVDKIVSNISQMDFIYEKTDKEKNDYTWNVLETRSSSNADFNYWIYLQPTNETICNKISRTYTWIHHIDLF